jgi:hypothetical protein
MLRPETLDGVKMHISQLRLCRRLPPQLNAGGILVVVLDLDAEYFAAVDCVPAGREVVDVPCFVDGLVLPLLEAARIVSAHWRPRCPWLSAMAGLTHNTGTNSCLSETSKLDGALEPLATLSLSL